MPKWFQRSEPPALRAAQGRVDRRSLNRRGHAPLRWQDEIDIYDDNGPGVVGNYLDLIEDKVRDAGLRVELLDNDGLWQPLPDGEMLNICLGVMSTYQNEGETAADLVAKHSRLSASMGEAYGLTCPNSLGVLSHYVAHPRELQDWQQLGGRTRGSVVWENPLTGVRRRIFFPSNELWRSWVARRSDPQFPTSELKRALPHIREYVNLLVRGDSDARSRVMMNDLIVFADGTDTYEPEDEGDPLDGMPEVVRDWLDMASMETQTNYHDQRPVSELVPFPMIGEEPHKVEIGRPLDESLPAVEEAAIGRIATSLRCPKKYLVEGPGNSKYDNEAYLTNALLDDCIEPIGGRVCGDITRLFFRPVLTETLRRMGKPPTEVLAPYRLRLAVNIDRIRPKPDRSADMLRAWELGVVAPAAVTDALDAEPLERPADMSDWDFWKATAGKGKGEGEGGVPAPLRNGSKIGLDTPEMKLAREAVGGPPEGPNDSRALRMAAAVSDAREGNGDTKEGLLAALVLADQRLFSAVSAASQADLRRAYAEVGRRISRALPARSPLRARIRDVEDAAKWQALQEDGQAHTNLELATLAAGVFDELRGQVQASMRTELAAADARLQGAGVPPGRDETWVEDAGALLVAGLTAILLSRLGSGSDSDSVPDRLVVDSMLVAGGAKPEGDRVARDGVGTPLSADGTVDTPGTGAAIGPSNTRAMIRAGMTLQWRWEHGLYRTPLNPHEPHLALDKKLAAAPGPIAGSYPGDHPWCSCGFVPVLVEPR